MSIVRSWRTSSLFRNSNLRPPREGHRAAGARFGAVARYVVDELHTEIARLEGASRGDPIADLRGPRLEVLDRQARQRLLILVFQAGDNFLVELFVDDEVREPAGGDHADRLVAVPGVDRTP